MLFFILLDVLCNFTPHCERCVGGTEEQPGSQPGMPELFSAQGSSPGCEQQVCAQLKTCRSVGQVADTLIQLLHKAAIC